MKFHTFVKNHILHYFLINYLFNSALIVLHKVSRWIVHDLATGLKLPTHRTKRIYATFEINNPNPLHPTLPSNIHNLITRKGNPYASTHSFPENQFTKSSEINEPFDNHLSNPSFQNPVIKNKANNFTSLFINYS